MLLTDDLAFWWLGAASGGLALPRWPGLALLFVSFWAVYEIGYADNDRCAVAREADPVVSVAFGGFEALRFIPAACLWALLCGAAGLAWLGSGMGGAVSWAVYLASVGLVFFIFNRLDKPSRVWLYPVLAGLRAFGYLAVLPAGPAGLAAGLAQIFARFLGYFTYRQGHLSGRRDYPTLPLRAVQTVLLAVGLTAFGRYHHLGWPALAMMVWSAVLARRELLGIAQRLRFLKRR
jgi:hypothetical protein